MLWLLLLACTGNTDTSDPGDTGIDEPDGHFCDPAALIGSISVERWGEGVTSSFSARVYDAPSPWIGVPQATTDVCGFYLYEPALCTDCEPGQLCSHEGECVDPPVGIPGATLALTADGVEQSFEADETGLMWGTLESETRFTFDLEWSGGHVVIRDELELRSGLVPAASASGDYDAPGTLTVSWSGVSEGHVRTRIPINHHAGAPTFTQCQASASAGGFEVPAEMVDPLSVITGLEFQGLVYGDFAAVQTEEGCVQVQVASHYPTDVQYP